MSGSFSESVLVFSGLDPSGGAGLSADIETINQFCITALPIVTTLTAQNTSAVTMLQEVDCALIDAQFEALNCDIDFQVVKIGLLSSAKQINTIANCISKKSDLRVILDPIIFSSSNKQLLDENALRVMRDKLIYISEIITPNEFELALLAPGLDEVEAVKFLNCCWTLVTGADSSDNKVEHRLYQNDKLHSVFNYVKLPGRYHGSGCTLASSISALIALGFDMDIACKRALDYCYQTLLNAKKLGKMQYHPNRSKPI